MTHHKLPLSALELSIGSEGLDGPFLNPTETRSFLSYRALSAEKLHQIAPGRVSSWLFCAAYDAYDIAQILSDAGFGGTYTAFAATLPSKALVRREIRACFPGLKFELHCPSELPAEAAAYHRIIAHPARHEEAARPELVPA